MMVAAKKRAAYEARFKVEVLAEVDKLGSVAAAARKYGLEPGLVYGWTYASKAIRHQAEKDAKQEPMPPRIRRLAAVEKRGSRFKVPGSSSEQKEEPSEPKPKTQNPKPSPRLVVRAKGLEAFLEAAIARELPAVVEKVIGDKLEALAQSGKLSELVGIELERRFMRKAEGGDGKG